MFISVVVLVRLVLTLLSLALGALAFSALSRRRLAPEVPVFVLLVLSLAVYCFGYAGEVAQTTRAGAMFWLHVEYFGIPWFPALWLLMARNLNGLRSRCGLLFAVPIAAFAGEQTNSLHGLFDRSIVFIHRGPFWVLAYDRGFICWVYIAYLDFACLYGAWIYATRSSAHGRTKTQAWVLVASSLVPMVGHFIYMLGWAPWGLDVVPMLFSVTAFLMYLSVFKLGSIDLIPMAHSLVFGNMRDAVLVANL